MLAVIGLVFMAMAMMFSSPLVAAADSLYIGDVNDSTVKKFDASTGTFQGSFVKSQGGIQGPIGIIFDASGNLLLANQIPSSGKNPGINGEILLFNQNGKLLNQIVKSNNSNAPFAPQGIILINSTLFVADQQSPPTKSDPIPSGVLRRYLSSGGFLGASVPDATFTSAFHPRGVVLGPDGYVYVAKHPNPPPPFGWGLGGQVLRFDANTGAFKDVVISSLGGVGSLNRPVGLTFGPDGRLYVTSFRADSTDNDKILIYNKNFVLVDSIDLDTAGNARTYAEALLFGPDGKLFAPITSTGEVRRYDVSSKLYDSFVPAGGPLEVPWFLTFGKTVPSTLVYP